MNFKKNLSATVVSLILLIFVSCAQVPFESSLMTWDEVPPQFINRDFLGEKGLLEIQAVSKFRSGQGHDNSDSYEGPSSMKHYLVYSEEDKAAVPSINVYSPVSGLLIDIHDESESDPSDKTLYIRPESNPAYTVILYHIITIVSEGDRITAGQKLGSTPSDARRHSAFDIEIQQVSSRGVRLVSYFDIITDSVFQLYRDRAGNPDLQRPDFIITKEYRAEHPVTEFTFHPDDESEFIIFP